MDFISVKEASDLWKMDVSTIGKLLRAKKIPGATQIGGHWVIPKNAERPTDGRTKEAKNKKYDNYFRFPLLMDAPETGFVPPLSSEEAQLRTAQLAFLACDFEKAQTDLKSLADSAQNIDVRIAALFFLCYLSAGKFKGEDFNYYFNSLNLALSENTRNKSEMDLFLPLLFTALTLYTNASNSFRMDIDYDYSPSVLPWISILTFVKSAADRSVKVLPVLVENYENVVRQTENSGCYYAAQELHVLLFIAYYMNADQEHMDYHLRKAFNIAQKFDYFYPVADVSVYYSDAFERVLKDYPDDFANSILHLGVQISESFSAFMSQSQISDIYLALSKKDYQFIYYGLHGYSNREVANLMNLSERTVAGRYSEIYDKLGVAGKQDLFCLMMDAVTKKN